MSLKFIAWIDNYDEDDCDYEGVFLQNFNIKSDSGMGDKGRIFVINEKDAALFVLIVRAAIGVGGLERRSNQLRFNFDFNKLGLA